MLRTGKQKLRWTLDNSHKIRGNYVRINGAFELSELMINRILSYLQSCVWDDCASILECKDKEGSNYLVFTIISLIHFIPDLSWPIYWCLYRHLCDLPERFGKKNN